MASPVTSVKDVFEQRIPAKLRAKPDLVTKIAAVYQFDITGPDGGSWTVDLASPGGRVYAGSAPDAGCTVTTTDADFIGIVSGKLDPAMAFMMGKLKIRGDMGLALKLQQILT